MVTSLFIPHVQPEPRKHKSHRNLVPNHGVHPAKGQQREVAVGIPGLCQPEVGLSENPQHQLVFLPFNQETLAEVRRIPMFPRLHLPHRRGCNANG